MQVTSLLCSGNPGGSVSHALIQCKPPPTLCSRPAVTAGNPPHAAGLPTRTTTSLTGTVNTASCKASRPPTLPMATKSIAPLPRPSPPCSQPAADRLPIPLKRPEDSARASWSSRPPAAPAGRRGGPAAAQKGAVCGAVHPGAGGMLNTV